MSSGFQYQLVGSKYASLLAVSLYTLRKYHVEPIQLLCGDEASWDVMKLMVQDQDYLDPITVRRWEAPMEGGKGQQHANKATGVTYSPFDQTIFLDADTVVVSKLNGLWPKPGRVCLTRFSNWVTTGNIMRGRLDNWKELCPEQVEFLQNHPAPAINTGVFSFTNRDTGFLKNWKELTDKNPVFMSDELAAQIIFLDHDVDVLSDRYNFSPKHSIRNDKPIRVVHFHGMQHARPDKSEGWKIWTQYYLDCWQEERCGIRSLPMDKHLRNWLSDNPKFLSHRTYGK